MSSNDIDDPKNKRLCYHCIDEEYLHAEVKRNGKRSKCSFCGRIARSYSIQEIAERIEIAFDQHYRRSSDQPDLWQQHLLSDRESDYEWEREGEPVVWAIANSAMITEEAATDIQTTLEAKYFDFEAATLAEETEFSSESYYEEKYPSDEDWQGDWSNFENSLKTEARFFSRSMSKHLETIFSGIDTMTTTDDRPVVINAGPEAGIKALFRARVFQSDEKLKESLCRPDLHIGPPPATLAIAGRMNAHGISVFYGSDDQCVAISEVRPPVGSKVVVARFDLIRQLRLLDLTALGSVMEKGSIFDPGYACRLERASFLRSLSLRLTQPVMPDHEAFEYLSTQVIADFLANENEPMVDGIIFPSVQAAGDGLNIVLFNKSSRVELIASKNMKIEVQTGSFSDDGWEIDYSVTEFMLPEKPSAKGHCLVQWPEFPIIANSQLRLKDMDSRDVTLRIDTKSIQVHIVRSVQYQYESHEVSRQQSQEPAYNDDNMFGDISL